MCLRKPPQPKTPSITEEIRAKDEEQRLRDKAYEIWEKRGKAGTPEENWNAAIEALQRQQRLQPFISLWRWTGIQEKKGWDVVQLLVGISIPIILFVGGQYFTSQNNEKQQKLADDKTKQDRQLADDKAKQDTLVKYLDQMADSLNKDDLLTAKLGDKKFIVAQSRTILALQSLDKKRQHLVIQFLQAAGLNKVGEDRKRKSDQNGNIPFKKDDKVLLYYAQMSKANLANSDLSGGVLIGVNLVQSNLGCLPLDSNDPSQCSDWSNATLSSADLSGANLSGANLLATDLSGANLWSADLTFTDLTFTDLTFADLTFAKLSGAILSNANLSGAILLATDLRHAKNFDPTQLGGDEPPLLCSVALPEGFKDKDKLQDRDCAEMPQELFRLNPQDFKSLKDAKQYVDDARQWKWK